MFHLENALVLNTALLFSHRSEQNQEDVEKIIYTLNLEVYFSDLKAQQIKAGEQILSLGTARLPLPMIHPDG